MQNAVIYARYSSNNQSEQSIEGQMRACREYAEREGYLIIEDYIDRAISGKTDNRPAFQKMLRDSKKRQFEFVIVYKLDRFARNRRDAANYRYNLRINGVNVLSAMEQLGDNPESIILEAVLEAQAEYYSVELSQKVRRGLRESVIKGNYLGGHVPYGFKVIDKKVYIDDERAAFVKYMFTEYAKGKPKKQIINELIAKGAPSWHGKTLTLNTFQSVLKSEKYIGKFTYNNQVYDKLYPAIIDDATFYKVQEYLKLNKHAAAKNKAKIKYILQGKIFCGNCGSNVVGTSGTAKSGERYLYYSCSKRYKYHTCEKLSERKDFLEYYICEQTIQYALQPNRLNYIADNVVLEYEKTFNNAIVINLEKQISKINAELDKATTSYINAPDALRERITEKATILDNQLNDLKLELSKSIILNKQKLTKEEVIEWIKLFTTGNINDENFRIRLIDIFVNSIYIFDDKIIIYFNIKDCKQISFIDMLDDINKLDEKTCTISNSKLLTPPERAKSE